MSLQSLHSSDLWHYAHLLFRPCSLYLFSLWRKSPIDRQVAWRLHSAWHSNKTSNLLHASLRLVCDDWFGQRQAVYTVLPFIAPRNDYRQEHIHQWLRVRRRSCNVLTPGFRPPTLKQVPNRFLRSQSWRIVQSDRNAHKSSNINTITRWSAEADPEMWPYSYFRSCIFTVVLLHEVGRSGFMHDQYQVSKKFRLLLKVALGRVREMSGPFLLWKSLEALFTLYYTIISPGTCMGTPQHAFLKIKKSAPSLKCSVHA